MPDDSVALLIEGRRFEGWKQIQVRRSIETAAASFAALVTERHPNDPVMRAIRPGDSVSVRIGADRIITGFIDDREAVLEDDGLELRIQGRSLAADLVDCAPDIPPNEWSNIRLDTLAKRICAPFGITVTAEVPVGDPWKKVALSPGQTAWELLEERARYRSVLLMSDGLGRLLITRAGLAGRAERILEGGNLLNGSLRLSHRDRFKDYIVRGQSAGTANAQGTVTTEAEGRARDKGITRFRPLVVVAASAVDAATAKERAEWEALTRAARGDEIDITVQGWRQSSGTLWTPNTVAHLEAPGLGIDTDLVLASVTFRQDAERQETQMVLRREDAFNPLADEEGVTDTDSTLSFLRIPAE